MKSNPRVYMMSGRTGAGKTTIAKKLATEKKAYRISHDEWLRIVHGADAIEGEFRLKCDRINDLIWKQVESLTGIGIDIILEGWGSRRLRDEAKCRLKLLGVEYEFVYVDCPREVRWIRVKERNVSIGQEGFPISQEEFTRMENIDEEFGADESATIIDNSMHNNSI